MMIANQRNDLLVRLIWGTVFDPGILTTRTRDKSHLNFVCQACLKFSLTALKMAANK